MVCHLFAWDAMIDIARFLIFCNKITHYVIATKADRTMNTDIKVLRSSLQIQTVFCIGEFLYPFLFVSSDFSSSVFVHNSHLIHT